MASFKSSGPYAIFLNAGGMITMSGDAVPTPDRNLTAIAVSEKVIVGLSSDEAITRNSPYAVVTDLEGALVVPVLKIPTITFCGPPLIGSAFSWETRAAHRRIAGRSGP